MTEKFRTEYVVVVRSTNHQENAVGFSSKENAVAFLEAIAETIKNDTAYIGVTEKGNNIVFNGKGIFGAIIVERQVPTEEYLAEVRAQEQAQKALYANAATGVAGVQDALLAAGNYYGASL